MLVTIASTVPDRHIDVGGRRRYWDERGHMVVRLEQAQKLVAAGIARIPPAIELCRGNFLIRRTKAMGDLLCLLPVLAALRDHGAAARLICGARYQDLLRNEIGAAEQGEQVVTLDGWLERHPDRRDRHATALFADRFNLGAEVAANGTPRLRLDAGELQWARWQIGADRADDPVALVFLNAGWITRRYPLLSSVAELLSSAHGLRVRLPEQEFAWTLRDLAAGIAAADLVITGDTGPLHLAAAVGTPSIAVFGATNAAGSIGPGYNSTPIEPEGLDCWPCWRAECTASEPLRCMQGIDPREVAQAAVARLQAAEEHTDEG
jgi:hypothetical protein